jgi:NitT/TauT family transport system permease protein
MTVIGANQTSQAFVPEDAVTQILRSRRRRRLIELCLGALVPIIILSAWQAAVAIGWIDRRLFPPPSAVIVSAVRLLANPAELESLSHDVMISLMRLLTGYVIGGVCGIAAGLLMGIYPYLRAALSPSIFATFPTPKLALFPLILVVFGIGSSSIIALVTVGVFYMTCINTLSGVLHTNPIYQDMAKAFKIPLFTFWFRIVAPSALPSIISGLRLALGQGLILVVAAEFVASNDGLGQFIWNSWQLLDIPRMFVGLTVAALIGVLVMIFGNIMEHRLIPWSNR